VVDGSDAGLPASPFDLMHRQGGVAQVPVFLDFAKDEGTLFSMMMLGSYPWQRFPTFTHSAVDAMLHWTFGNNDAFTKELLRHYPTSMGTPFIRLANAITDSVFKCSNRRFANALAPKIPIFVGETEYDASKYNKSWGLKKIATGILGPNHLMATSLVFGVSLSGQQLDWTEHDQAVSSQLNCYYAFFLHCRDPDVTDRGACFDELVRKKVVLRSCLDPTNHKDIWSVDFKAYNPAAPTKFALRERPKMEEWTSAENGVCDFWDANPPSNFRMVPNICRGCKEVAQAA
jgi:carboxylesterase type B